MRKQQSGFVDAWFVLALLVLVAATVFTLWKINQTDQTVSDTTAATVSESTVQPVRGEDELPGFLVQLTNWTETSTDNESGGQDKIYDHNSKTATLSLYTSGNPRIFYSSNAPVYCEYEDDTWVHYSAIGTASPPEYERDSDQSACELIESQEINGLPVYTRVGGALGQIRYIVTANVDDIWYVFRDHSNYDDLEASEEELDSITAELKQSLHDIVSKTIRPS